jgi:hypothetical protein
MQRSAGTRATLGKWAREDETPTFPPLHGVLNGAFPATQIACVGFIGSRAHFATLQVSVAAIPTSAFVQKLVFAVKHGSASRQFS